MITYHIVSITKGTPLYLEDNIQNLGRNLAKVINLNRYYDKFQFLHKVIYNKKVYWAEFRKWISRLIERDIKESEKIILFVEYFNPIFSPRVVGIHDFTYKVHISNPYVDFISYYMNLPDRYIPSEDVINRAFDGEISIGSFEYIDIYTEKKVIVEGSEEYKKQIETADRIYKDAKYLIIDHDNIDSFISKKFVKRQVISKRDKKIDESNLIQVKLTHREERLERKKREQEEQFKVKPREEYTYEDENGNPLKFSRDIYSEGFQPKFHIPEENKNNDENNKLRQEIIDQLNKGADPLEIKEFSKFKDETVILLGFKNLVNIFGSKRHTSRKYLKFILDGIPNELRNNKKFIEQMVKINGIAFSCASIELKTDKEFALRMVSLDCISYKYVPEEIREDYDFSLDTLIIIHRLMATSDTNEYKDILKILYRDKIIPEKLTNNVEFVVELIELADNSYDDYVFFSEEIRYNYDVVITFIKSNFILIIAYGFSSLWVLYFDTGTDNDWHEHNDFPKTEKYKKFITLLNKIHDSAVKSDVIKMLTPEYFQKNQIQISTN